MYEYDGSTWSQLGQDIDGENSSDKFGHSVSLSQDGSILAIGANGNDGNGINSGYVRMYTLKCSTSVVMIDSIFQCPEINVGDTTINHVMIAVSSDRRLKENIEDTTLGLDFIKDLKPVSYKWINDREKGHKTHQGLIAQDVEVVMDARGMSRSNHTLVDYDNKEDKYRLNYIGFIAPLIKAVQELKLENENLKSRVDALERK